MPPPPDDEWNPPVPRNVSISESRTTITKFTSVNIQYSVRRARPEKSTYCLRTLTYQFTCDPPRRGVLLGQMHVLVVHGLVVDAFHRWRYPARHLPALVDRPHERADVGLVGLGGQPPVAVGLPHVESDEFTRRGDVVAREQPDLPVEPDVGQRELPFDPGVRQDPVPPLHAGLAVGDVLGAQVVVERDQRRDLLGGDRFVADRLDLAAVLGEHVVVLAPLLL